PDRDRQGARRAQAGGAGAIGGGATPQDAALMAEEPRSPEKLRNPGRRPPRGRVPAQSPCPARPEPLPHGPAAPRVNATFIILRDPGHAVERAFGNVDSPR